jgi:hypothetical protein
VLTQPLLTTDDVIYVDNAARLSQPDLEKGIFGYVTVSGERISYRERDLETNTVSGLRRGTAGTAAADHASGTEVYDIGIVNLLPAEYQNSVIEENFLADGVTTEFVTGIQFDAGDLSEPSKAVEVYVGGVRQLPDTYTVDPITPVTVTFNAAPNENYQVSILVRQAESWYQPGLTTPSNGVALQDQQTAAARFIRGK